MLINPTSVHSTCLFPGTSARPIVASHEVRRPLPPAVSLARPVLTQTQKREVLLLLAPFT